MYIPPNNHCFIDGNNLHLTYRNLKWKLDYKKLRQYLLKRHRVTVAHYFIGYIFRNSALYANLKKYGYALQQQSADRDISGNFTHNCDQFLINMAKWTIEKYDQAIIISGDHHFADLVRELDSKGKLKLVLAPCRLSCAWQLRKAAGSKIAFLDDLESRLKKEEE